MNTASSSSLPRARTTSLLALVALVGCGVTASSGDDSRSGENVGRATAFLVNVPAGVSCVEIDVVGARTVTNRFDVTPNQPAALSLTGLPLGNDTFTGLAYPVTCANVISPVQATWISDPTSATLTEQIVTNVSLSLHPNGQASVGVGFNPDDAGTDASDAGKPDSGPTFSFANPLQVSGIPFNADTIQTPTSVLNALTPMDGPPPNAGHDFPTVAVAQPLGAIGLPNNAFFSSSGSAIPNVQLAWGGPNHPLNTFIVSGAVATFQLSLPPGRYHQVQLYATSTNGPTSLTYSFTSAAGSAAASATVPDWCLPGALAASVHTLGMANRVSASGIDLNACSIFAIDLNPDPNLTLTGVSFAGAGSSASTLVVYGATAW